MKPVSLVLAVVVLPAAAAEAANVDASGGLSPNVDQSAGTYELTAKEVGWTFGGKVAGPMTNVTAQSIKDEVGTGKGISFSYVDAGDPTVKASILI